MSILILESGIAFHDGNGKGQIELSSVPVGVIRVRISNHDNSPRNTSFSGPFSGDEFLKVNRRTLCIGSHYDVGFALILALLVSLLLPSPFHGQASKMNSFAGPSSRRTNGCLTLLNAP